MLTLDEQEVKQFFEVIEDLISQFSDDDEGSPWFYSSEESTLALMQLNFKCLIKINDGEEIDWISMINMPRVFLSVRRGTYDPASSHLLIALRTREPRKTSWMRVDYLQCKCLGLGILLME